MHWRLHTFELHIGLRAMCSHADTLTTTFPLTWPPSTSLCASLSITTPIQCTALLAAIPLISYVCTHSSQGKLTSTEACLRYRSLVWQAYAAHSILPSCPSAGVRTCGEVANLICSRGNSFSTTSLIFPCTQASFSCATDQQKCSTCEM